MLPPVYHCHYYCAWSVCVGGAARKVPAKLDVSCSCVMIITVRGVCIV